MPQAGVLAVITEFVGAVALGARVTSTIKVKKTHGNTDFWTSSFLTLTPERHHHYRSLRWPPDRAHACNELC